MKFGSFTTVWRFENPRGDVAGWVAVRKLAREPAPVWYGEGAEPVPGSDDQSDAFPEGIEMMRSFLAGVITGGLVVWFWKDEIKELVEARTRTVRTKAADGVQAVEETAEQLLDRAAAPFRRAEVLLEHGKAQIGANLRAVEKTIRPEAPDRPA